MMNFTFDELPGSTDGLEEMLARHEDRQPLKPGTQAKIIWHDQTNKAKTPYAIVYLHGFSASSGDGDPVHKKVAQALGANLYLARLYGHGLRKSRPLGDLTPQRLIASVQDALAVGRKIGDRVVLMASSAGGLLALYLASLPDVSSHIAGLVLYSPLVHLYGINAVLLEHAFTRNVLRCAPGPGYLIKTGRPTSEAEKNIWYSAYQLQGVLALGQLIQQRVQPSLFQRVHCPVFTGYYFKNKHQHDQVVSAETTQRMMRRLGTAEHLVEIRNFPNAGTHIIGSSLFSRSTDEIIAASTRFLRNCVIKRDL